MYAIRSYYAALAREGAEVIVNGRTQDAVDAAGTNLKSLTGCSKIYGFTGDMSLATTADAVVQQYPKVEILINNLGIFEPKPFEDIPDEDWLKFFNVNVLSGVRLARLYLPFMKRINFV